jgi:hypothetical protein
MTRFVFQFGFRQFQQIVAWLLLVTFVPIAILSEGAHLLPGFGTCCQSFDFRQTTSENDCQSECDSHHQHHHHFPQDSHHKGTNNNTDDNSDEICVVCEFCSIFNSVDMEAVVFLELPYELSVGVFESFLVSGEFFSLFLARAPPMEV